MLLHHLPGFVPFLFPHYVWHKSRKEREIYLTFDDGPVPGVTDFVLDELEKRQMKANFFMVGDNVVKHPELALKVKRLGHQIGNHTHNHLDGFSCPTEEYVVNVKRCQSAIRAALGIDPHLFRAPYGRLKREQRKDISQTHQVIMWDVIPGDYDQQQSSSLCLSKAKQYTKNGSIILFHDQEKTARVLSEILPDFLDFIQSEGYRTNLL